MSGPKQLPILIYNPRGWREHASLACCCEQGPWQHRLCAEHVACIRCVPGTWSPGEWGVRKSLAANGSVLMVEGLRSGLEVSMRFLLLPTHDIFSPLCAAPACLTQNCPFCMRKTRVCEHTKMWPANACYNKRCKLKKAAAHWHAPEVVGLAVVVLRIISHTISWELSIEGR